MFHILFYFGFLKIAETIDLKAVWHFLLCSIFCSIAPANPHEEALVYTSCIVIKRIGFPSNSWRRASVSENLGALRFILYYRVVIRSTILIGRKAFLSYRNIATAYNRRRRKSLRLVSMSCTAQRKEPMGMPLMYHY